MRTLFVCATNKLAAHNGESYDAVVEVVSDPSVETIDRDACRIREAVLGLHIEQAGDPEQIVECKLHGPTPYVAILRNLKIILSKDEGITMNLPFEDGLEPDVTDPETIEALKKMG